MGGSLHPSLPQGAILWIPVGTFYYLLETLLENLPGGRWHLVSGQVYYRKGPTCPKTLSRREDWKFCPHKTITKNFSTNLKQSPPTHPLSCHACLTAGKRSQNPPMLRDMERAKLSGNAPICDKKPARQNTFAPTKLTNSSRKKVARYYWPRHT